MDYASNYGLQPLAICYEYGLGCDQNLQKAIDLHLEHLNVCDEGWKRYSLYRLGVLNEKLGAPEIANTFYKQSLHIYVGDWPSFHYRKGKMYEKGQGIMEKEYVRAEEHYKAGMELDAEFTLQLLFKKKCELAYHKFMAKKELINSKED
jgi:TPR repeat protein